MRLLESFLFLVIVQIQYVLSSKDPYADCRKKVKVSENDVFLVMNENKTEIDHVLGPYFVCVWQHRKVQVMNNDGAVSKRRLAEFILRELRGMMNLHDDILADLETEILRCDLEPRMFVEQTAVVVKNCHAHVVLTAFGWRLTGDGKKDRHQSFILTNR
ncbi:uncharacterized protein LOC116173049 [Photinus pyralis]|uniref:uncharacterized protein LOC116173049 n=1 Tax=Photinus pyralis TaxID=7054 RepID=UPI0012677FCB|nr:uncharacterized protein LOC116173049 [Photinus pyralis]